MELIDKETAYNELSEYYHHTAFIQHLCLSEALDRVPVVDAIPIERIERYIPEIEDNAPDVALALKGFIGMWKAEQR